MTSFIIYAIETAISLALFYTVYWVFLKNDTFFKLKRAYLLATAALSLFIPLLNLTPVSGQHSFLGRHLFLPIEQYRQQISSATDYQYMPPRHHRINIHDAGELTDEGSTALPATGAAAITEPQSATSGSPLPDTTTASTDWLSGIMIIYFSGVVFFFLRFIAGFIMIYTYMRKNKPQIIMGKKLIRLKKNTAPFSFWNTIFIGNKEYPDNELFNIIAHESMHIRQKHTVDLALFGLLLSFQWFNPFAWLYRSAANINHEYLADQGTLNSGVDLPAYQYALLNEALGENKIDIASNYNLLIKKRITMMKKKRSPKFAALKLAIAAPVFTLLFSAFAFNTSASTAEAEASNPVVFEDNNDDYLKLIEGEYVSTNEPGHVRKIRFTEVLGELIANDNGYIYKLKPVSGGKFINPDDQAKFEFDTKDKSAISLLLFEKIRLKKIPSTKTSVAFSVLSVTAKDGTEAGLAQYAKLKGAADTYLYEGELNYAGYQLLQAGKAKEAAALFKLNTEAFPKSFNVYDSYGEALMALGEKSQAYDNYKKSLELNPVSPSAIKVLKDANLYTDTVIKKLSPEDMKLLEGDYYATRQPTATRKITVTQENGGLTANDNGYKYKLIPLGSGRFVNPDDGMRITFNTADKNAITLRIFGDLILKKAAPGEKVKSTAPAIKKVKMPVEKLKELTGEYVSTNENQRKRKITFVLVNNELVGDDNGYVYKIIPVGNGKFINPDDDATLEFNTADKNNITLLLFGIINLKKVK